MKRVPNFRILKAGVATVDFQRPVDVSQVDFQRDVLIDIGIVDIYRNKRRIPAQGNGLNTEALICMEGIGPMDTAGPKSKRAFERGLTEFCKNKQAQFILYRADRRIFQFLVPNFNEVYDLSDLDG
jgi:hypothetical protein